MLDISIGSWVRIDTNDIVHTNVTAIYHPRMAFLGEEGKESECQSRLSTTSRPTSNAISQ